MRLRRKVIEPHDPAAWLLAFHGGDRDLLAHVYVEQYPKVASAVGRILRHADAETVVHEVFYRLVTRAEMRQAFHGGNLGAWIARVAVNQAIDFQRRWRREQEELPSEPAPADDTAQPPRLAEETEAKVLVERFRRERLPAKWEGVFETRFMRQLPQREAAKELGMSRTTLVYQEQRIRELLRDFLLHAEGP